MALLLINRSPIDDLYQLDRNTKIDVTPKEDGLNIRCLRDKSPRADDKEVLKAAKDVNKRYGKMMKNLAK